MTLRIEAGLPLTVSEWQDSRTAWTDHDPGDALGNRPKDAQGRARRQPEVHGQRGDPPRGARRDVALGDDRHCRRLGRLGPPPPRRGEAALQGRAGARLGAVAAPGPGGLGRAGRVRDQLLYSPVLQRHIGLARVRPDLAAPRYHPPPGDGCTTARTRSPRTPPPAHFNPARKTAKGRDPAIDWPHRHLRRDRGRRRPQRPDNAAYLAKAGLRTLVLEQRHLVGGAAITRSCAPASRSPRSPTR